ncbi:DUF4041 domain-containing protein [Stenotrophomonas sp. NPDC077464]|uniref:DUF4041 domain-containing protein n=1 Tax=unclassified Stenotrophomonas TaxID=196198 RepID=UPI0037D7EEAE
MSWILSFALAVTIGVLLVLRRLASQAFQSQLAQVELDAARQLESLRSQITRISTENEALSEFKAVRDADAEARRMLAEAEAASMSARIEMDALRTATETTLEALRLEAQQQVSGLIADGRRANADARQKAERTIEDANRRAAVLVKQAEIRAESIAGDAYRALQEAETIQQSAVAMRNVIEGYGDLYLKPTYSLLDQLAQEYEFESAAQELKLARANSISLVTSGRAAECDYVEKNRRETAIRFVIDAFNGKVDTILGRLKSDNFGILEQQVRDAFSLVNHNGSSFRSARITREYLDSRLEELRWGASSIALRERDREEQRRIREQIREEERAQREIDRALKEAAKEEDMLQRALSKARVQLEKASEEQRSMFEAQMFALEAKLAEAEAKNQRALSMAQQTKAGHVYVISNIGSFGDRVFKVGMTRRLQPHDRVKELGDASVPFPFDVHAMIWSDDAPALEGALHRKFVTSQVNKVNPRKEFFRLQLGELRGAIEELGLQAAWTMAAEAAQFRESQAIEAQLSMKTDDAQRWIRAQLEVPDEQISGSSDEREETSSEQVTG